jgi:hypothetical protein
MRRAVTPDVPTRPVTGRGAGFMAWPQVVEVGTAVVDGALADAGADLGELLRLVLRKEPQTR